MMEIIKRLSVAAAFLLAFSANGQELLTIEDARFTALENNFDIRIARTMATIDAENNTLGNAGYLPMVDANFVQEYDWNNTRLEFVSGDTQEGRGLVNQRLNAGVLVDWTIFGGFAVVTNSQRLDIFEKQGELATRVQIENTLFQLDAAYYEAVSISKQIKAIQTAIDISAQRLSFSEERRKVGSGSGLEVLQARVDMNADSAALVRQEFELNRVKSVINELMAREPSTPFATSTEIPLKEFMAFANVSQLALSMNNDLFMARNNQRLAELDERTARATYYPELHLQGLYNFQTSESEAGFLVSSRQSGLTYGLTARWSLFNGGNNRREAKVARLRTDISREGLQQSELQLKGELYRIYESYMMARQLLTLEERNAKVARQNLDIATEQMRLGSINALELREAQRNMVDAEFRLIQASFEAKMAETDLLRLSGQLLD